MDALIEERNLGSASLTGNNFTQSQRLAQQIIALVTSSVSILAGSISLYWFFRMRTHFRHHLIILLILSDLFKAIWYFIPAAIGLSGYQSSPSNAFCQANGFFLALGIEASDMAILIVAIHSALCIFKPRTSLGEAGLFNLRYAVYALWFFVPLLMAGLGLMQGGVYISQGAFCYLPIRPFWYRLGLAWIPRYMIFVTICILYIRIYWFVSKKFKQFDLDSDGSHKQPSDHRTFQSEAQPKPDRSKHASTGLWADNATEGGPSITGSLSQSITPIAPRLDPEKIPENERPRQTSDSPAWENYTFGDSRSPIPPPEDDDIAPIPLKVKRESSTKTTSFADETAVPGGSPATVSLAQALSETGPDLVTPTKAPTQFSDAPSQAQSAPTPRTPRPKLPERPDSQYVTAEGMRIRHTAIKRQLRFLFVYPVFYLLSWLVPLAQHLSLYWDNVAAHPIFGLSCASTFFLALQCAIDAFIFSTRETPWRYIARGSSSNRDSEAPTAVEDNDTCFPKGKWAFWRLLGGRKERQMISEQDKAEADIEKNPQRASQSGQSAKRLFSASTFSFRSSGTGTATTTNTNTNTSTSKSGASGSHNRSRSALSLPIRSSTLGNMAGGKSKGEMVAEARAAKKRREMETSVALEGRADMEKKRKMSLLRRGGADRAWWEVEGRRRKDSVLLGTEGEGGEKGKEKEKDIDGGGNEGAEEGEKVSTSGAGRRSKEAEAAGGGGELETVKEESG
ncbi:hypothetical protein MMC10_011073 [Thelotrema lepadinum]|nr:hypothetical protein [Thelotrema lepadinum]